MRLQIKTLSPVHIGNGEKYNGLAYIANRENVLLYDSNKIMENLTTQQKQRFMLWLEQNIGEIERLETQKRKERDEEEKRKINQTLRDAQKKLSLKEFIENSIRDTTTKNKFNNNFLYSVKAETKIFSNVDIDCFTKQNNKSYIPGTEIKGGIRTAVAYHLLQDEGHWRYFKKRVRKFRE
ncbi:type III-A CRISPR-associated RAMP protein Csm5 [Candidatus Brocadia sinica]|uniref:CRISPR system Cms protein Csm5 n=1 Tax=Candidatus Brocadia sinica JPN1 TaxID=1197129 RepID=A0ABQ0JTG6_9BACT|nr:type III-A CRISPR-associated RAMP protein Csm5 [Candidatus Brocadia sinica]GAN32042.1 CRISPR-associated RAMP protein Csm5 [Candidatus Brocadia sinica JPN1]